MSSSPSPSSSTSPLAQLSSTLSSLYRVTIPDNRTFIGTFSCIDKQGNLILTDTQEYAPNNGDVRSVGMVLIPKKHWVKVERERGNSAAQSAQKNEGEHEEAKKSVLAVV